MARSSEAILALEPVTFRYKKELEPGGIPQFDLVAEEVDKMNPTRSLATKQASPTRCDTKP